MPSFLRLIVMKIHSSLQRYGDTSDWKIDNFIAQNIYLANIEGQKINVLLQIIFHKHAYTSWTL